MEGISENYKKKSRRAKRGNVKTRRNLRKRTVHPATNNNETPNEKQTEEEEFNQEGGFFKNLFSWF